MLNAWSVSALWSYGAPLCASYLVYRASSAWYSLSSIPTVGGPSFPLLSYIGGFRFLVNGPTLIREGYERYRGGVFKIAALDQWQVILCGSALADEVRKLPDNIMSFYDSSNQFLQTEYMLSPELVQDLFHVDVLRTVVPRKLDTILPTVCDEIQGAIRDFIPASDDWTAVLAFSTMQKIICRASNRMLVGAPLCRDPEWMSLNINFAQSWVFGAQALRPFPDRLKRIVGRLVNPVTAMVRRGKTFLTPVIAERRAKLSELGPNHPDKPDDFLTWLIEGGIDGAWRSTDEGLTQYIMAMNFASIETTSITLTNALYDLAVHPQYIEPLREEVQAIAAQYGWTKAGMSELHKLDSFLRESNRYWASSLAFTRLARKQHTFSNGMTVPAGTLIALSGTIHFDEDIYPNSTDFEPFRFLQKPDKREETWRQQLFVTPSPEYLPFGLGKHACPGRFFAGHEIKAILANIILNYDIKAEQEAVRPPSLILGAQQLPNRSAKVLFRKRV